jgi:hypothetical protein
MKNISPMQSAIKLFYFYTFTGINPVEISTFNHGVEQV